MGLWTLNHFYAIVPAFIIFAGIAILLGFLLKNKSEETKLLPLRIIASSIVLLELAKQLISLSRGYDLYHLPFHYCSLFIFLLPLHAFAFGKLKKYIDGITFATTSSLFLFFVIVPTILYPESAITNVAGNFFDFHTLAFHHLVVLYLFIAIALGQFKLNLKRDFAVIAIVLSGYVIIATILSYTLKVNFQNLRVCNMAAIDNIRVAMNNALGWFGQAIYIFVLFVLTTLFGYLSYFLIGLFYKNVIVRKKKENKK